MAFRLDPEIAQLFAAAPVGGGVTPPPRGDWLARRTAMEALMGAMAAALPLPDDVERTDCTAPGYDGTEVHMRWYRRRAAAPGSAVLYVHGGGMILGSVDLYDPMVASYVSETGVPMLSVDYRLAPENPHPAPVEDCYTALRWLADHAGELGADPSRVGVMGDSGGGGLAAAVALLARDRGGPHLARQVLVYPMLDDRTTVPDPELVAFMTWTYDDNFTGWSALVGDAVGGPEVSPAAAPARATDLAGLPPTYMEVGELDIFRDEDVEYAQRLAAAGVPTELHVHPGAPHGFDQMGPGCDLTRRARADRVRVLQAI
jgi:acetyl esterase/lipase